MEDAFSFMNKLLDAETIETPEYIAEINQLETNIAEMQIKDFQIPKPPMDPININVADREHNLIYASSRADFRNEVLFHECDLFTAPLSTTNTMEGYISNLVFHERDLIELVKPDEHIVIIKCNYGIKRNPNYAEAVKPRMSNRGRKKKPKTLKLRKKQGAGIDFNSQITFVVRPRVDQDQVYKFKVFRTGKMQLPGVINNNIDDVVDCSTLIVRGINSAIHAETPLNQLSTLVSLSPVMKNYKFQIKIPQDHIIDMLALQRLIKIDIANPANVKHLLHDNSIFMFNYTRQDTKASLKFSTPIPKKPKKKTRINIFMRGKVNILGAMDITSTQYICDYIRDLFKKNKNLIIRECIDEIPTMQHEQNIFIEDEEFAAITNDIINWCPGYD